MKFGLKLQSLRKEKGLSQEALAEKLNVSRQAVSKWETGEGYPEIEKLLLISELFQVSLDYLMKDIGSANIEESENDKYFISSTKIEEYMKFKKIFAFRIAMAVSFIILSLNLALLFEKTKYEYVGIVSMLIVIALAVALIIITGLSNSQYEKLEKRRIYMSFNDLQDIQVQYAQFKSKFGMAIAIGVCLIIVSLAMVILISEFLGEDSILGSIQLLCSIAIAVFMFIVVGIENDMYNFLLNNHEFIEEKNKVSIFSITMPLAAMIYLFIGLTMNWWHPGWIIFPITAIITLGIEQIYQRNNL